MTPVHLIAVAVLSVLSTAGVLVGGAGAAPDLSGLAKQVQTAASAAVPVGTTEAAPAQDAAAPADTEADAGGAAADDTATVAAVTDVAADAVGDVAGTTTDAASEDAANVDVGEYDDTAGTTTDTSAASTAPKPTRIKHVFVITVSGYGADATFGVSSAAPYLAKELRAKGTLLTKYSSLGRAGLADRIALISGQPPNAATKNECATYQEIPASVKPDGKGRITQDGCVYPNTVTTIGDQVTGAGQVWKSYAEDQEKGPKGPTQCRRPQSNAVDETQKGRPGDGYAARNVPFVYFRSLIDLSDCDSNAGPLTALEADLKTEKSTPTLSWIAPGACSDGSDVPCADGSPGGLAATDAFLKTWVPKILASPAYKADGLLLIVPAGGTGTPAGADAPVVDGALVLSRYVKAGGTDETELGPYALLRTVQDALGLKALAESKEAPSLVPTVLATARVIEPGDD